MSKSTDEQRALADAAEAIAEYLGALTARPKLSSETKEMETRIKTNLAHALKTQARTNATSNGANGP